ncbi:MAG: hypothetical protein AB8B83_00310 [Bdellovibrionales bacterium]
MTMHFKQPVRRMTLTESYDALINTDRKTIAAQTHALPKPTHRPSDFCFYSYNNGRPKLTSMDASIPTNDRYA